MSDHETYAFDMLGYIVVPDVLTPEQLRVANAAIDQMEAGEGIFLNWRRVVPSYYPTAVDCLR